MSDIKPLKVDLGDRLAKEIDYGVHATLSSMFGLKPQVGVFTLVDECTVKGDVSGIVTLTQEKIEGTLIVTFPKATIFGILAKMYRKPFTEVNQSVKLGVGELTNIIYGVVKANLNKDGFQFKMAVPSVVIGDQHTVIPFDSGPTMVVPFSSEVGTFHVLLSFRECQDDAKAA